jgi:hypothetical protein
MLINKPHEVLHGVKYFPNPLPKRNPGGDCFACALKAAIDYFYPDNPIPFDKAWEAFQYEQYSYERVPTANVSRESYDGVNLYERKTTTHLANHWGMSGFRRAIYHENIYQDYYLDYRYFTVHPEVDTDKWSHPWGWKVNEQEWSAQAEAWLASGWIMVVEMKLDPADPSEKHNWIDHFAIVDGQRSAYVKKKIQYKDADGTDKISYHGTLRHESHLVCSARGGSEKWIKTKDLLENHGVNVTILLRPKDTPRKYNNLTDDQDVVE